MAHDVVGPAVVETLKLRREVQHPNALRLLDFLFLGAAVASRNAALMSPSVPKCCTSRRKTLGLENGTDTELISTGFGWSYEERLAW
jgi:hypothetical protein